MVSYDPPYATTSYFPSIGEEVGYTNGNAKWADTLWSDLEGGVYNLEVKIKVREEALPGTELLLNYRSWGVASGKWLRDCQDWDTR